jgi:Rod binding domain-containing protein
MKKSLLSVLRNTAKDEPDTVKARKVKLRKAAEGFEAIFIRHILRIMRSSIQDGGMFGKGAAGEIYGDMMDNILAENMSKRSALGLADMLYRQKVNIPKEKYQECRY